MKHKKLMAQTVEHRNKTKLYLDIVLKERTKSVPNKKKTQFLLSMTEITTEQKCKTR